MISIVFYGGADSTHQTSVSNIVCLFDKGGMGKLASKRLYQRMRLPLSTPRDSDNNSLLMAFVEL